MLERSGNGIIRSDTVFETACATFVLKFLKQTWHKIKRSTYVVPTYYSVTERSNTVENRSLNVHILANRSGKCGIVPDFTVAFRVPLLSGFVPHPFFLIFIRGALVNINAFPL